MRARSLMLSLTAVTLVAACDPPVPESGAQGAGFDTPREYAERREAELRTGQRTGQRTGVQTQATVRPPATPPVQTAQPQQEPLPARRVAQAPAPSTGANAEAIDLANQTRAVLGVPRGSTAPAATTTTTATAAPAPVPTPAQAAPRTTAGNVAVNPNNPALSREQDFAAVSAERDIAADAERVRQLRQQYQVVQPTELQRPNDDGPNIIAYALERAQPRGTNGAYGRNPLASKRRSAANCQGYRTADVAQEDFLAAGGPERDRLNLDPDGDGNACSWDPATFRNLVRN